MVIERLHKEPKLEKKQVQLNNFGKLTKWKPEYVGLVEKLAILGALDKHIADILGVNHNTISLWKRTHPDFFEAVERGKTQATAKVAESLYLNCIDRYVEVEEVHVVNKQLQTIKVKKFIQGNPWLQARWMSLRMSEQWSESLKMTVDHKTTNINIDIKALNFEELALIERIQQKQLPEDAGSNV